MGESCAHVFADNGYAVLALDVTPKGEAVAADIRARGREATFVRTDVSCSEEVGTAIRTGQDEFGRIDALVNCAGIDGTGGFVVDIDDDDLDRVLAVNLKGTIYTMQHAARAMRETGGGSIVNVASAAAVVAVFKMGAYAASKGAVLALSRVAALELGRDNIRVNVICPGTVRTAMMDQSAVFDAEMLERHARRTPLKRFGEPSEIAHTALFLCSPGSAFMTGAAVMVDGGMTAV
jgi:NAD(P)-dependent dehydrogenase (short-subunit alcohol dehydrogenase family)